MLSIKSRYLAVLPWTKQAQQEMYGVKQFVHWADGSCLSATGQITFRPAEYAPSLNNLTTATLNSKQMLLILKVFKMNQDKEVMAYRVQH